MLGLKKKLKKGCVNGFPKIPKLFENFSDSTFIVGCRGASELGGSLLGILPRV